MLSQSSRPQRRGPLFHQLLKPSSLRLLRWASVVGVVLAIGVFYGSPREAVASSSCEICATFCPISPDDYCEMQCDGSTGGSCDDLDCQRGPYIFPNTITCSS